MTERVVLDPSSDEFDRHLFYMGLARSMEAGAKCLGSQVGAVVIKERRVLGAGYNGTPSGYANCDVAEQGCRRCAIRSEAPELRGKLYDICVCVHAEQNAMATAARFGVAFADGSLYTTLQPCFTCFKEAIQVGLTAVYYLRPWSAAHPNYSWVSDEYDRLIDFYGSIGGVIAQVGSNDTTVAVTAELGSPPSEA